MDALIVFRLAIRSLRRASARSALTTLGVSVGVSAVVATMSVAAGARAKVQAVLASPDSRTVYIAAASSPRDRKTQGFSLSDNFRSDDYYAIRGNIRYVSAATPRIYLSNATARSNGRAIKVVIEGISSEGFSIANRKLLTGGLFSELDVIRGSNVCVISESLAWALSLDGASSRGSIRLNGSAFTVVGIVDDTTDVRPATLGEADMHVYLPFTSLLRRIDRSAKMSIAVQASEVSHAKRVEQDLSDLMEQRRRGRQTEFRTTTALESITSYTESSLTVARLIAVIGAISLVVGGIGVMNIMLAGVAERTREIGIRMAAGTRSKDILTQVLVESLALTVLGGGIGIFVGCICSWFVSRLNGWPVSLTGSSIALAVTCSLAVGVAFGYHPARRASRISVVDALRKDSD